MLEGNQQHSDSISKMIFFGLLQHKNTHRWEDQTLPVVVSIYANRPLHLFLASGDNGT